MMKSHIVSVITVLVVLIFLYILGALLLSELNPLKWPHWAQLVDILYAIVILDLLFIHKN